jgi:hypothetical protein
MIELDMKSIKIHGSVYSLNKDTGKFVNQVYMSGKYKDGVEFNCLELKISLKSYNDFCKIIHNDNRR